MKSKIISLALMAMTLAAPAVYAKPERLEIKRADKQVKEKTARAQIKNIDLREIEDPAARKAIGEILNYLNLQAKK